jgi:hypothetical protein
VQRRFTNNQVKETQTWWQMAYNLNCYTVMKRNGLYLYKTLGGTHGAQYALDSSDLDLQIHAGYCSCAALDKLLRFKPSKASQSKHVHYTPKRTKVSEHDKMWQISN